MTRRSHYKKKKMGALGALVVFLLVLAGAGYYWLRPFDPSVLAESSVLQAKDFEADVREVVSPRKSIKAYLLEDRHNPIISVRFIFEGAGYAGDGDGEEGIANLAAALLSEGAGDWDAQAFKEELENLAIGLNFAAEKDDFGGSLLTTKENAPKAFELLKAALTQPHFSAEDTERVKQQLAEALKRQSEQPENVLALAFAEELYGKHPYGRNPLGKANDIASVDEAALRRFMHNRLSRQNLIVGIAGDMDAEEAGRFLDDVFGVLPANGRTNFVRDAEISFDGGERQIVRKTGQNIIIMAWPGVARNDEDFYPLFVANHIMGGSGLNSRLSQKIREEKGLTYGVYSYLSLNDKSPLLIASFSSTPEKYVQAKEIFMREWRKFQKEGATAEELKKAKDYLIASYNLRFVSISNIAEILAAMQKYNLGLDFLQKRNDYVRQVDLQQVNRAAAEYFDADKRRSAVIGDF